MKENKDDSIPYLYQGQSAEQDGHYHHLSTPYSDTSRQHTVIRTKYTMAAKNDLKAPTMTFLDIWCNEKNIEKGITFLRPDFTATHEDAPPKNLDDFIATWKYVLTSLAPAFKYETLDAIQEGHKIWVYARITGLPNGEVKDSVDMLEWDKEERNSFGLKMFRGLYSSRSRLGL